MKKSEAINELAQALAAAQGKFTAVPQTETAEVRGTAKKSGNAYSYTYTYAPLEGVVDMCRPHLSENGLSFVQTLDENEKGIPILETTLLHSSGQWLASVFPLTPTPNEQDFGGQITYFRRYALSSILGIVTEEDHDQAKKRQAQQRAQGQQRQQPPPQGQKQAPTGRPAPAQGKPSNGQDAPPEGPEEREKWLIECRPLFQQLGQDAQGKLLGKFSASSLEDVTAANQGRFKSALYDLTAQAA